MLLQNEKNVYETTDSKKTYHVVSHNGRTPKKKWIRRVGLLLALATAVSGVGKVPAAVAGNGICAVQAAAQEAAVPSLPDDGMLPEQARQQEVSRQQEVPWQQEAPEETWKPGTMPEEVWKESPLGSAGVLEGKSVLISIFIRDKETKWTKKEKKETNRRVKAAAAYLSRQAKRYGKKAQLIVDTQKNKKISYTFETEMKVTDRTHIKLNHKIQKFISESINLDEVRKKYKTDSIGFLLHINKAGVSYTLPHCVEEEDRDFFECASLFSSDGYQETGAATYAHEILHMFGAPDLYEKSLPDGITTSFVRYIEKNYPNEIMYTTYTKKGKQLKYGVKNKLSRVTAYFLGWKEKIPEQKRYPLADNDPRGSFHDGTSVPN